MKWISYGTKSVTFFLFLFPLLSYANNEWFEFYNNTRSQSMGGASIAVTSDETSLYRNPANLGSVREYYGTLLDPEIEGSSNFVQQVSSSSTGKAFEIPEVVKILGANLGTYYHAKTQLTPSLITRNFGIGLIYRNEISAVMNSLGTDLDVKYQNDIGAVLGVNFRLFDGRIKIGGSAKAFSRIELVNAALPISGPTDLGTIGSEGTAFSFDAGMLIQAPWTYIPTLGVIVRDIGATKFDKQDGLRLSTATRPVTVSQSVDAAIALFPIHGNQLRSVWTFEYSDITNSRNDTDNAKRIHAGIEINTRDIFFFRLGYNQRYWTAGFEIAAERFQWQVGSYGEEVGTATSPLEDRRLSTKFSLRF